MTENTRRQKDLSDNGLSKDYQKATSDQGYSATAPYKIKTDMQRWFETIADAINPEWFLTLAFPPHTSFKTARKQLNAYFRQAQQAKKIQAGLLVAGLMVQGKERIHFHAMVARARAKPRILTAPYYRNYIMPIAGTLQRLWHPCGTTARSDCRYLYDKGPVSAYLTTPWNLHLSDSNGLPQYELYQFNAKRISQALRQQENTQ